MKYFLIGFVVLCLLGLLVLMLLPGSPFLVGNRVENAQATAQAAVEMYARSTPLSDEAVVGMHGMDSIVDVAKSGFESNVRIAASGDAAQTSIAWSGTCTGLIAPLTLLGAALLILSIKWNTKKKQEEPSKE